MPQTISAAKSCHLPHPQFVRYCFSRNRPLLLQGLQGATGAAGKEEVGVNLTAVQGRPEQDMRLWECAASLNFWLLFLVFGAGTGTGLMFVNNLGASLTRRSNTILSSAPVMVARRFSSALRVNLCSQSLKSCDRTWPGTHSDHCQSNVTAVRRAIGGVSGRRRRWSGCAGLLVFRLQRGWPPGMRLRPRAVAAPLWHSQVSSCICESCTTCTGMLVFLQPLVLPAWLVRTQWAREPLVLLCIC